MFVPLLWLDHELLVYDVHSPYSSSFTGASQHLFHVRPPHWNRSVREARDIVESLMPVPNTLPFPRYDMGYEALLMGMEQFVLQSLSLFEHGHAGILAFLTNFSRAFAQFAAAVGEFQSATPSFV